MRLRIDQIKRGKPRRPLQQGKLQQLIESIAAFGLRLPIDVDSKPLKRPGTAEGIQFILVDGQYRLEACRRLGLEEIEAQVLNFSDQQIRLWQIEVNLCRTDLTALERAEHIAERIEIYNAHHPEINGPFRAALARVNNDTTAERSHMCDQSLREHPAAAFSTVAADDLTSRRYVERMIRRATKIEPRIRSRIRTMPMISDSTRELDALATLDAKGQRDALRLFEHGEVSSIREAKRMLKPKPVPDEQTSKQAEIDRQVNAIIDAWERACPEARKIALEHIQQPHVRLVKS